MAPNTPPDDDRRSVLKAAGALGAFFGTTGVASADDGGSEATELLVGLSPTVDDVETTVASALAGEGSVVHSNEVLGYVTIELPEETPETAKDRLERTLGTLDAVDYIEENATLEAVATPNDTYYGQQDAPQQIGCEAAWDRTYGDSDVVIAVVDQGVQYDHEDLAANVDDRIGEDFTGRGSDPYPVNTNEDHGTIVAGIAAGETNNGTGHAGISNCSLLCARALDESGSGSLSDIADAIQWAVDQGVDVINLSLGASSGYYTLKNACQYAVEQGTLPIAAAGNDGGAVSYPAAYDSVLAVSAVDSNDRLTSFSNYGEEIDVAAPGSRVVSSDLNDSYTRASGTSMAAPVVSGVAGLVLSLYPDLSADELRTHLRETAEDVGISRLAQGYGRIDADAAVNTVPDGHEPDDDGNENDGEEDDEGTEVPDDLLALVTEADAGASYYDFVTDGPVEFAEAPYESPSGEEIKGGTWSGDTIDETGDGTWAVSGGTSTGHGDAYRLEGAVTAIDLDNPSEMWLELGGERMTPEEVIEATGGNDSDDGDDRDDDQQDDENDGNDGCGTETKRVQVEDSLSSGWWGYSDRWTYSLQTADPCGGTISIDGPSDADFDLYVTTDGSRPSRSSHDAASTGSGSDESVTVDLDDADSIRVLVYAESGSGTYTLTIEENGR
ncbi:S8 family peptidase [Halopiger goleimassiliensis]|uniref:S8 family peptidase n=1 Tax=Halopiger goleimassiliensis TaxID=1293048 RepID=UPI0006779C6A|nr:S8 family serine peptidase [Halopiger goleimassiliensis]